MGKEKTRDIESYGLIISKKYFVDLEQIVDYIEYVIRVIKFRNLKFAI